MRHSKLPRVRDQLLDLIEQGALIATACKAVGIGTSTYYSWVHRGEIESKRLENNPQAEPKKSEQPYLEFLDAQKKALANAEILNLETIRQAAQGTTETIERYDKNGQLIERKIIQRPPVWQAAAWFLERRYPLHYSRKDRMIITRNVEEALNEWMEALTKHISPEALRELRAYARKQFENAGVETENHTLN